jgi:hypothetical protein
MTSIKIELKMSKPHLLESEVFWCDHLPLHVSKYYLMLTITSYSLLIFTCLIELKRRFRDAYFIQGNHNPDVGDSKHL